MAERQLTILANSDAHDPIPARASGYRRPITLVFARTRDADGVRDAMINRRTAAWAGDDVWGAEEHLQGLWAGAVTIETPVVSRKTAPIDPREKRVRDRDARGAPRRARVAAAAGACPIFRHRRLHCSGRHTCRPCLRANTRIQLQLEVMNLHPSPGRNLTVTVPLTVRND